MSSTELILSRKLKTKLTHLNLTQDSKEMKEIRKFHDAKKLKWPTKKATHKELNVGNKILTRQQ